MKDYVSEIPGRSVVCTEKSDLVRRALGDDIFDRFIENKRIEWDAYRSQVHQYEIDRYLPVL